MSCAPDIGKALKEFIAPRRKIEKVYIHCSAASRKNIDAKEVHRWHRKRGWSCIGYHYFIKSDAKTEIGRDINRTPAGQAGHNSKTIAICVNGLWESDFTKTQLKELVRLCKEIKAQIPGVTFHGHCEVSPKACPVFDYKAVLGLDAKGRMVSGGRIKPGIKTTGKAEITISRGAVKKWQGDNGLFPDGIIGPKTWTKLTK